MSELTFDDKKERAVILGEYIVENKSTVRAAAKVFSISKSTVHHSAQCTKIAHKSCHI